MRRNYNQNYLKLKIVILFAFFNVAVFAQVNYNFEDGKTPPDLVISDSSFVVNMNYSMALQHNKVVSGGFASFYQKNTGINAGTNDIEWQFNVDYAVDPSQNNRWLFWLMADTIPNKTNIISGYAVGVNFNESSDTFRLWKVSNNIPVALTSFKLKSVKGQHYFFKIKRYADGNWECEANTHAIFKNPILVNEANTSTFKYWGFNFIYTPSYAGKIYVDDITISSQKTITNGLLKIKNVVAINQNSLQIFFTEPYWEASLQNTDLIIEGKGNAIKIESMNATSIKANFDFSVLNPLKCKLIAGQIADAAGNFMLPDTFAFNWQYLKPGSIVVSEIMFDPNADGELPPYEYIELHNSSGFDINLHNWQILIGTKAYTFNNCPIKADSLLIVCNAHASNSFASFGIYYNLPLNANLLSNSGTTIKILDSLKNSIFYTRYYGSQLYDNGYNEGGVSLETTCLTGGCPTVDEWQICQNIQGGTPGTNNSWTNSCNEFLIKVNSLQICSDSVVLLGFNKAINNDSVQKISISLNSQPVSFQLDSLYFDFMKVTMPFIFKKGQNYILELEGISDCMGNVMPIQQFEIAAPDIPQKTDVVINEVLFDVSDKNAEFVELYNVSDKIIDAGQLNLKVINPLNTVLTKSCSIAPLGTLFYPNSYIVITRYPQRLTKWYNITSSDSIWTARLPILNNNGSLLALYSDSLVGLIDSFTYSPTLHNKMLNNTQNVSLERTSSSSNAIWASASAFANYATPGLTNSQQINLNNKVLISVNLTTDLISPDADGVNDNIELNYSTALPGWMASISIFSTNGALVNKLYNNELLATSGTLSWNLQLPNGTSVDNGMYILLFSAFNNKGAVFEKKLVFVVGS